MMKNVVPEYSAHDEEKPKCVISGWGTTEKGADFHGLGGDSSNTLLYRDIPIHSFNECKRIFHSRISESGICAGGHGPDTCQGNIIQIYFVLLNYITFYRTELRVFFYFSFNIFCRTEIHCRLKIERNIL